MTLIEQAKAILEGKQLVEKYFYTGNCTEYDDGNDIQRITQHDDMEFPEETYGHDPKMQISSKEFYNMTGVNLKKDELAFWNKDIDIVFRYNPNKDIHYFYER